MGFAEGASKVGGELEAMAAGRRVETAVRKAKVFDVHEFELQQQAGGCVALGNLDHAGGEVDPDDVAVR